MYLVDVVQQHSYAKRKVELRGGRSDFVSIWAKSIDERLSNVLHDGLEILWDKLSNQGLRCEKWRAINFDHIYISSG